MLPFRFALHTSVAPTMAAWRDRARAVEELGYSALYVADHLDAQFGPLVAATIAAEATTTLRVGTLVLNNDLRHPVVLAKEIATLGLAAEGRIDVGLGAGWRGADYREAGIDYDAPGVRVERMAEALAIMKALWSQAEATLAGKYYTVRDARCDPRPLIPPRVIVGGGSKRVLTVAARQADIVSINSSLASPDVDGSPTRTATADHFDRCVGWVREAAGSRLDSLELQSMTIAVISVSSKRAAMRSAMLLGLPADDIFDLPAVLVGTVDEICERLIERRERWGVNNVVVPVDAMDTLAPVVARLAGT